MVAHERLKGKPAGLIVRLAAAAYDGFLLFSVSFLTFIPVTLIEHAAGPMPTWLKSMLLFAIAYAYFVGFWTKAGATTGMKAWKLRVAMADSGEPLGFEAATMRFFAMLVTIAALGLPMVTIFFTRRRQAVHDVLAGTTVYRVNE